MRTLYLTLLLSLFLGNFLALHPDRSRTLIDTPPPTMVGEYR